jgi:hypothetical protein
MYGGGEEVLALSGKAERDTRDMHAARERQGIVIVSVVDHWLRENEESFHATAASACLPACLPLQDILELYFDPATGLS